MLMENVGTETQQDKGAKLTWLEKLYLPKYRVEPSFFFFPQRDRKQEDMPLREKINLGISNMVRRQANYNHYLNPIPALPLTLSLTL